MLKLIIFLVYYSPPWAHPFFISEKKKSQIWKDPCFGHVVLFKWSLFSNPISCLYMPLKSYTLSHLKWITALISPLIILLLVKSDMQKIIITNLQEIFIKSKLNIVHKYRPRVLFRNIFMASSTILQTFAETFARVQTRVYRDTVIPVTDTIEYNKSFKPLAHTSITFSSPRLSVKFIVVRFMSTLYYSLVWCLSADSKSGKSWGFFFPFTFFSSPAFKSQQQK